MTARSAFSFAVAGLLAFSLAAFAAEKKHGKEITLKETTKISAIFADPASFQDKQVLVEGTIVDVCKKRGCWIKIAEEGKSDAIIFKVTDGVMVFPVECQGSKVKAQGTVAVIKTEAPKGEKAEGHEGHAEGGAKCDACTQTIMIKGEGAVVFDAPKAQ